MNLITYSNKFTMAKNLLDELLKKETSSRQESLRRMLEHPYSYEEMMNQVKRNKEIRRQNMLARQRKAKSRND